MGFSKLCTAAEGKKLKGDDKKKHVKLVFKSSYLWALLPEPLFINKRFALNEMLQRNASKFAIFYV